MADHWMQFGTFAQKDFFEYPRPGVYKGVVLNGNMVAHAPAALAGFLLEKTSHGRYIIDPLTHAFQHHPAHILNNDGLPKSSIRELANSYGPPVTEHLGIRSLRPADFTTPGLIEAFVQRCIDYQLNVLPYFMKNADAAKYLEHDEKDMPPYAVISPYFYLDEIGFEEWLSLNAALAHAAAKYSQSLNVRFFAMIVLSQAVLSSEHYRGQIESKFKDLDCDGIILWIDNFDEQQASILELASLWKFTRNLKRNSEFEIINLHGGYFSVLLSSQLGHSSLSGVTHGPEFGEFRSVVPVGGGIPISRYYIPKLHARIRFRDALGMLRSLGYLDSARAFHGNVCSCEQCIETIADNPDNFILFGESNIKNISRRSGIVRIAYPTREAQQRCLRHYLQRKHKEFTAAKDAPPAVLLSNLENAFDEFEPVASASSAHLLKWHRLLKRGNPD